MSLWLLLRMSCMPQPALNAYLLSFAKRPPRYRCEIAMVPNIGVLSEGVAWRIEYTWT